MTSLAELIRQQPSTRSHNAVAEYLDCPANYVRTVRARDARRRRAVTLIQIPYGDPRWAAWLQHWRNEGCGDAMARIERQRQPIKAPADLPPETPGLKTMAVGDKVLAYYVPRGSPEWASHVALLKLQGQAGRLTASRIEGSASRDLKVKQRWGWPGANGGG